ncbi:hypothetical protein LTS14_006750 [Recurvomyces mirabilis]|nr:hypothetical protein LTS14_006750 [Recurvomyces mirabilis]
MTRTGRYFENEGDRTSRSRTEVVAAMDGAADGFDGEEESDEDEITVNAAGSANKVNAMSNATRSWQNATKVVAGLSVVGPVTARLVDRYTLVVRYSTTTDSRTSKGSLNSLTAINNHFGNDAGDDNVDGPNARGTYAREYTLRHPEIKWVHRGQGRYLPAVKIKCESMAAPERRSRHSRGEPEKTNSITPHIKKENSEPDGASNSIRSSRWRISDAGRIPSFGRQESSAQSADEGGKEEEAPRARAVRNSLTDSLSHPPQYGLRQRQSDPQSPSTLEHRTARLARRAKLIPSIERGRTALRRGSITAATNSHDNESETECDEEEDMADDDLTKTYTKAHVQANKHEEYHHTGNGWYRKGPRPSGKFSVKGKERSSDRAPPARAPAVNYTFDEDQTVHRDDLGNYPGMMFHHKGNAWFRPGVDTKNRPKTKVVDADGNVRTLEDIEKDEGPVASTFTAGTVDKAYADAHPDLHWEHRGNGRYAEKPKLQPRRTSTKTTTSSEPVSTTERRKSESQATFSKEYVLQHPGTTFYHTGNARYKLGARPQVLPASLRAASSDGGLVDRAYVDAHPGQEFHHRGQGRYARGARLSTTTPALEDEVEDEEMEDEEEEEEEEEEDDLPPEVEDVDEDLGDRTRLVDSSFVNTHTGTTFHHKGQGRWAFGLPPPGSHNKVAVRGPKAIRWNVIKSLMEKEDPEFGLPKQNELLRREDGPDKFPGLTWVYRGGGKWARLSKADVELGVGQKSGRQSLGSRPAVKKRRVTGPPASTAASIAGADEDEEMMDEAALNIPSLSKPKKSRQRKSQHTHPDLNASKNSSTSHSQAPTPKPRMLEPDEDVLTDSDLPDIYHETTPPTPEEGDEDDIDRALRQQFHALNTDALMASLTKFDPAVRSTKNLYAIAENTMKAMAALQEEYMELDKITAPHNKIPKRPVKGGREPVEAQIFEDRKEADLYDYVFEKGRVGFQDPEAQKIVRDAEGRELRKRRRVGGGNGNGNGNGGVEPADVVPGWRWGEEISGVGEKRASRQPARFDNMGEGGTSTAVTGSGGGAGGCGGAGMGMGAAGNGGQPKRKARNPLGLNGKGGSLTPGRGGTPILGTGSGAASADGLATGKAIGNVPRRIQELRGESVASDGGSGKSGKKGKIPGLGVKGVK